MTGRNGKEIVAPILGICGGLMLSCMSWGRNMPLVVWLAPALLLFSFRNQKHWYGLAAAALAIVAGKFLAMHGGWDNDLWLELIFSALVSLPFLAGLSLDRLLHRRFGPLAASFVFPVAYVAMDFVLAFLPLGMGFAAVNTQAESCTLIQAVSLFGCWFLEFLIMWFAPAINLVFAGAAERRSTWKIPVLYGVCLMLALAFGSVRMYVSRPGKDSVRIAAITVKHTTDYWAITDQGTPRAQAPRHKAEMRELQAKLMAFSQREADAGAKIIFWSEGNCVMYEDDYPMYMEMFKRFAKQNEVYFMPAILVLRYEQHKNSNIAAMINPRGGIEFVYEKTKSWYPTDSSGIIPAAVTPYGKIACAICFDMDFPGLIRQAAGADIMLVPGFDTEKITPFHSRIAVMRGVENGFSVVRACNEGASLAADYRGHTLAYRNYFLAGEGSMVADVPCRGVRTLYGIAGEWFGWVVLAAFLFLLFVCGCDLARSGRCARDRENQPARRAI